MKSSIYVYLKRYIDILFSCILIVVLFPLFVFIALIIKLYDRGPVIFTQDRLGKDGVLFKILKFRSMKMEAPNLAARQIDNEKYVTVIGRFLRRSSLDELPQLFNILKGDMSFVGPRPFILNEGEINELRKEYEIDKLRPGLTGWAQVVARETCNQKEKLRLDLYYKENISFLLDTKIILYTFTSLTGK